MTRSVQKRCRGGVPTVLVAVGTAAVLVLSTSTCSPPSPGALSAPAPVAGGPTVTALSATRSPALARPISSVPGAVPAPALPPSPGTTVTPRDDWSTDQRLGCRERATGVVTTDDLGVAATISRAPSYSVTVHVTRALQQPAEIYGNAELLGFSSGEPDAAVIARSGLLGFRPQPEYLPLQEVGDARRAVPFIPVLRPCDGGQPVTGGPAWVALAFDVRIGGAVRTVITPLQRVEGQGIVFAPR